MLRKLASQTAIYGVSTILVKFINYMLTPYLSYILSTRIIGVQGYFYSLVPFGLTILTMGFETGYFRFYSKCESPEEQKKLFSTLLFSVLTASVVFLGLLFYFTPEQFSIIPGSIGVGNVSLIPIVGAIIAIDAVMSIVYAKLRAEGRAKRFLVTRLINVLVNVGLCVFFYSGLPHLAHTELFGWMWNEGYSVEYAFIANLIASAVTLLVLLREVRLSRPVFDFSIFKLVFLFSFPLMISGISGIANEFIDRQLMAYLLPEDVAASNIGIYTTVMKIAALIYLFTQMYRFAAEPFFLSNVKKDDFKASNAMAMKYFVAVSLIIFLFVTLYIDAFQYLVGKEFRVGLSIVPILLVSNIFVGVYVNLSFWYKVIDKTWFGLVITILGLSVTITLNVLLVPRLGYEGAAWARLGCEAAMVLVSYFLNQKYYPIRYNLREIFMYVVFAAALFVLGTYLPVYGGVKYLINTLLFITFIVYFFKHEKINVVAELKRFKNR